MRRSAVTIGEDGLAHRAMSFLISDQTSGFGDDTSWIMADEHEIHD